MQLKWELRFSFPAVARKWAPRLFFLTLALALPDCKHRLVCETLTSCSALLRHSGLHIQGYGGEWISISSLALTCIWAHVRL